MNILGHCCYFGNSGYAIHSRNFFRELSKKSNLKIRNFSVDKNWLGLNNENPYGDSADSIDKKIVCSQTTIVDNKRSDHNVFDGLDNFNQDVDIVLVDCYHHYFYDNYKKKKIFYNVWEKTFYPDDFFQKLLEADELWVPSNWQAEIAAKQGYPINKIKIVPEGIDANIYFPNDKNTFEKFTFLILGKWEDRKSTKELVSSFVELFGNNKDIQLILCCDNNFPTDQFKTTEERLDHYKLNASNIKIQHFLEENELINIMKSCHVYLSCSRSEGWNLPLIQAMACGIPSIYSDCSGQLEFAKNKGLPVKIHGEINDKNNRMHGWYSPDYNDLKYKMLEVYNSYSYYKNKALSDSLEIRTKFTWENAANIAIDILNNKVKYKPQIKIINDSGSLGDFIAWTPIVAKYAKINDINVDYYTPHKEILSDSYKDINFYDYGSIVNKKYDKVIPIGVFEGMNWQNKSLQQVASDILGLEKKEEKCKITLDKNKSRPLKEKYVCIALQSTCQCKYWNNKDGWQKTVDYLNYLGYKVICIDKYNSFGIEGYMNVIPNNCIDDTGDKNIFDRINTIMNCEFFIGLSSGLSWLAWACNKNVVLISGFTDPNLEFYTPYRVHNTNVCNSCWNDANIKFDKSNWLWCPRNKNFECSKEITFDMVKKYIDQCIKDIDNKL